MAVFKIEGRGKTADYEQSGSGLREARDAIKGHFRSRKDRSLDGGAQEVHNRLDEGLFDVLPEWSGYSRIKPRMRNYVGMKTLLPKVKVAELNILAHELKKEIVWLWEDHGFVYSVENMIKDEVTV